jgi:hypothetical protein
MDLERRISEAVAKDWAMGGRANRQTAAAILNAAFPELFDGRGYIALLDGAESDTERLMWEQIERSRRPSPPPGGTT